MTNIVDREGIFKAKPLDWSVKKFDGSSSVAINIRFEIVSMLNDQGGWDDWTQFVETFVYGDFFVLKRDGSVNDVTVKQLSESLGWNGSLHQVATNRPPDCIVQVSVKHETYNGKSYFKAGWINPENFTPSGQGEDADSAKALDAQFGSLLRAAANSGARPTGKPASPAKKPKRQPDPEATADLSSEGFSSRDDTPF